MWHNIFQSMDDKQEYQIARVLPQGPNDAWGFFVAYDAKRKTFPTLQDPPQINYGKLGNMLNYKQHKLAPSTPPSTHNTWQMFQTHGINRTEKVRILDGTKGGSELRETPRPGSREHDVS